jgi:hypothetical protein
MDYVEKRPVWMLRLQGCVLDACMRVLPMGYLWRHSGEWPNYTWQGRVWLWFVAGSYGTWELWRMKRDGLV